MKPQKKFPLILILALCSSAHAKMYVHMGYVDDETNGTLAAVLKQNPDKTVIAVSLDEWNKHSYLGKRSSEYAGKPVFDETMEKTINGEFKEMGLTSQKMQEKIIPDVRNLSNGQVKFSAHRFGPANTKDVIVVLKSPDVGRQQKVVESYYKGLFSAFAKMPQAKDGMHLSAFGTAGGTSHHLPPDTILPVQSSMFVGAKSVPGSKPEKYTAMISFAKLGEKGPPAVIYEETFKSRKDAEAAASKKFLAFSQDFSGYTNCVKQCGEETCSGQQPGWVSDIILKTITKFFIDPGKTSLSTSYFASEMEKAAADKLGITNVNMEDHLVIDAVNSSGKFKSANIARVIADPEHLSDKESKEIADWFRKGRYSTADYEDAILWGLNKRSLDKIPNAASWDAFPKSKDIKKKVSVIKFKDGEKPLDPFYAAMSANLLDDLDYKREKLINYVDPSFKAGLSKKEYGALKQAMMQKEDDLSNKAYLLNKMKREGADEEKIKAEVKSFVADLGYVDFQRSSGKVEKVPLFKDPNGKDYKIWVGYNDTIETQVPWLSDLEAQEPKKLETRSLERILYKTALRGHSLGRNAYYAEDEQERMESLK